MSALRRAATTGTDVACRAVGRRHVVRAARFVFRRACLDVPNDLRTNGESFLQRWTLGLSPTGRDIHVVDVGASVSQWSDAMRCAARQLGQLDDLDLHAFEPSSYTFARLSAALEGQRVSLHQVALGDRSGQSTLHVVAPGAGTNSLHAQPDVPDGATTEEVATTTLDAYSDFTGIQHVTLVKIDTEGHDLAVLRGARRLFADSAHHDHTIRVQPPRWLYSRSFLYDAFDLLEPFGYRLKKLTPRGVEFYRGWDADLETFVEGNYLACAAAIAERLPSVAWWKQANERGSR